MDAEQAGQIAGYVIGVIGIPVGVYLFGHTRSRSQDPAARSAIRRKFLLASIIVFLVCLAAAFVANLDKIASGGRSAEFKARFAAGFVKGCGSSCARRGMTEASCRTYCVCLGGELREKLGEESFYRLGKPSELTAQDRVTIGKAARQCQVRSPLKKRP